MTTKALTHNHSRLLLCALFLFIMGLQWTLISQDPVTNYDDHILLDPLKSLGPDVISRYFSKIRSAEIVDVQPVRDLSFGTDLAVKTWTKIGIHHLHNVIIWFEILIFFYLLLRRLHIRRSYSLVFVYLYGLNPCLWNSLSWISARKHLLSTLFTVAASYFLVRCVQKKSFRMLDSFLITALYFLGCFSQPINIGWPVFALVYILIHDDQEHFLLKQKNTIVLGLGLFISGCLTAGLNIFYYTKAYVSTQGLDKFVEVDGSLSFQILAFGRAFFQSFISLQPTPTPYYPGSILNFAGLILVTLLLILLFKLKNRELWSWMLFATLPILVVTVKMTHIFGSDTYILTNCIGCYIILAILLESYMKAQHTKIFAALFIVTVSVYAFLSSRVAWAFENGVNVMRYAYQTEATPFNLRGVIAQKNLQNPDAETISLSRQLMDWNPYGDQVDTIFSSVIYNARILSEKDKEELLVAELNKHPDLTWTSYYLGHIALEKRDFRKAYEVYRLVKSQDWLDVGNNLSFVMAELMFLCEQNQSDCSEVDLKIEFANKSKHWNQQSFERRLQSMRKAVKKN